jgi:opacity protein-like surface antigen
LKLTFEFGVIMKNFLVMFSSVISLFLASNVYSNPYNGQYYAANQQQNPPCGPCVGQCQGQSGGERHQMGGRFYVGAFGGANWQNYRRIRKYDFKPRMHTGYATGLSAGYKFDNGFRVEGEVAYRRNQLKSTHVSVPDTDGKGKMTGNAHTWSYMTNVLYDFEEVSNYMPNIVPYVGAGVGYVQNRAHAKADVHGIQQKAKARDHGIAGQAIAGVGYRLTDSTTLGVEYRYLIGKAHARDHSVGLALRQAF